MGESRPDPRASRRPGSRVAPAAAAERSPCGCAGERDGDLEAAVQNLSRKYNELAELVGRYMAEAGLERSVRNANAMAHARRAARIVGGVDTAPGEFPECCLIGRRSPNGSERWFCTGVLVHPRVVLTAAHCQTPSSPVNVVALNAVDQTRLDDAEIVSVRRVIVHPRYPLVMGNDISVLILRRSAGTRPVPLATGEEIAAAAETVLVGFGRNDILSTRGFGTQRVVTVDITDVRRRPSDDLDDAEEALGFESDLEFVAGGGGFDSCNGDSGGPAYIVVDGVRKVAGLTSRGTESANNPCGDGGIYTRVDTQRDFIGQVLQAASIAV